MHQGSVLSPLLFIIVLEALSREFREGLPMELLYADDLVLVAETEELLMEKLRKWKKGMELKGLRVDIGKTKVMRCQVRIGQAEDSRKYPCGVCKQGVGNNSIKCVVCHRWVHKRCSAKFKELSPILTVRGASYRIKGRIYSACVQSVLIYVSK